jgi:hypothetical protein
VSERYIPQTLMDIPENERQVVLNMLEENLRVAGDGNEFRSLGQFKIAAYPLLFRFETRDGRIWGVEKIHRGLQQLLVRSTNKGNRAATWHRNAEIVRLALDE